MNLETKLSNSDKLLAKAIVNAYEKQKSFDTAVILTLKGRDSMYIGNEIIKIPNTATGATLLTRLERLKEAGLIYWFEKQGTNKVIKILVREVRNQKVKKTKFIKQAQLQLF